MFSFWEWKGQNRSKCKRDSLAPEFLPDRNRLSPPSLPWRLAILWLFLLISTGSGSPAAQNEISSLKPPDALPPVTAPPATPLPVEIPPTTNQGGTPAAGVPVVANTPSPVPESGSPSGPPTPATSPGAATLPAPSPVKPDEIKSDQQILVKTKPQALSIEIQGQSPLEFGLIRARRGESGWVVVDPGGGYTASGNVAFSRKRLPTPGLVRVKAPPEALLLFNLQFESSTTDEVFKTKDGVALRAVIVGQGMRQLARNGSFWELRMPRGDSPLVEVELSLGGELQFSKMEAGSTLATKLRLECVSVETNHIGI